MQLGLGLVATLLFVFYIYTSGWLFTGSGLEGRGSMTMRGYVRSEVGADCGIEGRRIFVAVVVCATSHKVESNYLGDMALSSVATKVW